MNPQAVATLVGLYGRVHEVTGQQVTTHERQCRSGDDRNVAAPAFGYPLKRHNRTTADEADQLALVVRHMGFAQFLADSLPACTYWKTENSTTSSAEMRVELVRW